MTACAGMPKRLCAVSKSRPARSPGLTSRRPPTMPGAGDGLVTLPLSAGLLRVPYVGSQPARSTSTLNVRSRVCSTLTLRLAAPTCPQTVEMCGIRLPPSGGGCALALREGTHTGSPSAVGKCQRPAAYRAKTARQLPPSPPSGIRWSRAALESEGPPQREVMRRAQTIFREWLRRRRGRASLRRQVAFSRNVTRGENMRRRSTDVPLSTMGVWSAEQQRLREVAAARARHPTSAPRRDNSGDRDQA